MCECFGPGFIELELQILDIDQLDIRRKSIFDIYNPIALSLMDLQVLLSDILEHFFGLALNEQLKVFGQSFLKVPINLAFTGPYHLSIEVFLIPLLHLGILEQVVVGIPLHTRLERVVLVHHFCGHFVQAVQVWLTVRLEDKYFVLNVFTADAQ